MNSRIGALAFMSLLLSGCVLTEQEAQTISYGMKNISIAIEKRRCITALEDQGLDQINSVLIAHKSEHRHVAWLGKPPRCKD
jgi:hypothetical protein